MTIDDQRADAAAGLANLDSCLSPGAAVRLVSDTLLRIHPGVDRNLSPLPGVA
jgi:hypothetical protein